MMVSSMARGAFALFTLFGLTTAAPSGVNGDDVFLAKRTTGPCDALKAAGLSSILFYPASTEYNNTRKSYYSADVQDVKPTCILKPTTASQVSQAIKVLNKKGSTWNVAIKAGGHAPHASASSVSPGVTIDLARMKAVTYKSCKHGSKYGTAVIGAGAKWGDVYSFLEPQGLMVPGGREGAVGVAGLLLGGGFSWYEGVKGLSTDNVVSFEVVLADGSIVTASGTSNPDLFKALKGGLNNLGVVTKFEMKTFAAKNIYGGVTAFAYDYVFEPVLQKFVAMVDNTGKAPMDTGFVSLSWDTRADFKSVGFIMANLEGKTGSAAFSGLDSLGPVADFRATQPITGLSAQIASTYGSYNTWYTLSAHNTMDMVRKVGKVFDQLVADIKQEVTDPADLVNLIIVFSPLPRHVAERSHSNILGLDQMTRNSFILQPQAIMSSQRHQAFMDAKLRAATAELVAYAKATKQFTPFTYINYANPSQNPLASYGTDNVRFLSKTAKKYDPSGFFQKRVSGPFKVSKITP